MIILIGDDVRVSTPISIASFVRKPLADLPNCIKPVRSLLDTSVGSKKCNGDEITPGTYDVSGRSKDIFCLQSHSYVELEPLV